MALALGLALAIPSVGVIGAGIIHAQAAQPPTPVVATVQQAAQPDFTCHAAPGGWCDLRDWRGFADAFSPSQAQSNAE
jgi:hypothetical protein